MKAVLVSIFLMSSMAFAGVTTKIYKNKHTVALYEDEPTCSEFGGKMESLELSPGNHRSYCMVDEEDVVKIDSDGEKVVSVFIKAIAMDGEVCVMNSTNIRENSPDEFVAIEQSKEDFYTQYKCEATIKINSDNKVSVDQISEDCSYLCGEPAEFKIKEAVEVIE